MPRGTTEFFQPGLVMDYYDGNTAHRAVELRAELRDERQQLRHRLRAVHAGRAQPHLRHRPAAATRSTPTNANVTVPDPGTVSDAEQQAGSAPSTATSTPPTMTAPTTATPRRVPSGSPPVGTSATCSTPGTSPGAGSRAGSRRPRPTPPDSRCAAPPTKNIGGATVTDYSPHHEPFQYYKSTANPKHLPPSSEAAIGHTDQANHQYDLSEFYPTLSAGNMPAVSFLKAPAYQDGHAGYSNPIDEQTFLVNAINQIEKSKDWKSTAIVVTYDDSDGWYDHQVLPIVNGSNTAADTPFCSSKPTIAGQLDDPLRLQPAAAHARDLALDPAELRQQQPDQHRLGHQRSSRTTGCAGSGSAAAPSTRSRAASTGTAACSTSAPGRISGPSSSTRRRARS